MAELIMQEETSVTAPGSGKWKSYFKADGLYIMEDTGAESGPFVIANNRLINGGFDFAQRQVPGTDTTISNETYGPDRWRCTRENADLQYSRQDGTAETGITSQYFGRFKKITNTGKFLIYQPLEFGDSVPMRGRLVTFQVKMKASASKTVKIALVELTSGGTADTLPASFVSAWGANTVNPTLGTNLSVVGSAASCSVTTSWASFWVTGTIPTNSKNIMVAIWTDSQFAANDTLSIAEAGLYTSGYVSSWFPRPRGQEFLMCKRYYWKSFSPDVAPAQNAGTSGAIGFIAGKAGAASVFFSNRHDVTMFKNPNVTAYNPSAANAQARDITAATDCSGSTVASSTDLYTIAATGNAGTAVGNEIRIHATFEAEL
jgi:hypothetical protein